MYVCVYVCMYVCMYVCVYVCMCVCVYGFANQPNRGLVYDFGCYSEDIVETEDLQTRPRILFVLNHDFKATAFKKLKIFRKKKAMSSKERFGHVKCLYPIIDNTL